MRVFVTKCSGGKTMPLGSYFEWQRNHSSANSNSLYLCSEAFVSYSCTGSFLPECDQLFRRGGVNSHRLVKVGLCGSHFDSHCKALEHLITAQALHVKSHHLKHKKGWQTQEREHFSLASNPFWKLAQNEGLNSS